MNKILIVRGFFVILSEWAEYSHPQTRNPSFIVKLLQINWSCRYRTFQ